MDPYDKSTAWERVTEDAEDVRHSLGYTRRFADRMNPAEMTPQKQLASSGYYGRSPANDPPGPSSGSYRVLRGGGWDFILAYCQTAYRNHFLNGVAEPNYRCVIWMSAYFQVPADTFYVLTRALPHLPESQQQALRKYLQKEFAEHPLTEVPTPARAGEDRARPGAPERREAAGSK